MTINLATLPRRLAHRLGTGWHPAQYTVFGDNHALTARIQGPHPRFASLILDTTIHIDGSGTHRLRLELPHGLRMHTPTGRRTHPNEITAPLTTRVERLAARAHRELLTPDTDTYSDELAHADQTVSAGYAPTQTPTGATTYAEAISDQLDGETIGTMVLAKPDPATGAFDIDIDTADYVYDRNHDAWTPCTRMRLALAHGPATDAVVAALAAALHPTADPQP